MITFSLDQRSSSILRGFFFSSVKRTSRNKFFVSSSSTKILRSCSIFSNDPNIACPHYLKEFSCLMATQSSKQWLTPVEMAMEWPNRATRSFLWATATTLSAASKTHITSNSLRQYKFRFRYASRCLSSWKELIYFFKTICSATCDQKFA